MAKVTVMKTMNETDSSLALQCMDFTKQLASQGKAFKFSLSLPSGFNFSLDFSQEKLPPFRKPEGKKQSPSTLRRNTQRRKDYLAKKAADKADDQHVELEATKKKFKCDHCGEIFTAKDILNNHIAEKHLVIGTCDDCDPKTNKYDNTIEHKNDEQIEQFDGNSEIEQTDEEYEHEREDCQRKQEEHCKTEGAWCYDCNDMFFNRIVLKRHMHNDHNKDIYPEINIMLHGGW